jgi:hypothetical protein
VAGVSFTELGHRYDPQREKLPGGVGMTIRRERCSAALDGLPRLIKCVSQDTHFLGVKHAAERVFFQKPEHPPTTPKLVRQTLPNIPQVFKELRDLDGTKTYFGAAGATIQAGPVSSLSASMDIAFRFVR